MYLQPEHRKSPSANNRAAICNHISFPLPGNRLSAIYPQQAEHAGMSHPLFRARPANVFQRRAHKHLEISIIFPSYLQQRRSTLCRFPFQLELGRRGASARRLKRAARLLRTDGPPLRAKKYFTIDLPERSQKRENAAMCVSAHQTRSRLCGSGPIN